MLVNLHAIVEVLNGVEETLKGLLYENVTNASWYNRQDNMHHIEQALKDVQSAITEILKVK